MLSGGDGNDFIAGAGGADTLQGRRRHGHRKLRRFVRLAECQSRHAQLCLRLRASPQVGGTGTGGDAQGDTLNGFAILGSNRSTT